MTLLERFHENYIHRRRVRVLAHALSPLLPDCGRVLDVGCGDGLVASLIQSTKPGMTINGIDVVPRTHTHIPVTLFDGNTIPFEDLSFDTVLFVDVLHHTDDPTILLREAARVARDSIVIKDHLVKGWMAESTLRMMDRVGNRRHNVALPHTYWTRRRWRHAFVELNLTMDASMDKLGLYPGMLEWIFGRSLHFIARLRPASSASG
jgi:SAM-dependent methyltransferase